MALEMTGGPSRSEVSMWVHLKIRDPPNPKTGNQDTPLIHTCSFCKLGVGLVLPQALSQVKSCAGFVPLGLVEIVGKQLCECLLDCPLTGVIDIGSGA